MFTATLAPLCAVGALAASLCIGCEDPASRPLTGPLGLPLARLALEASRDQAGAPPSASSPTARAGAPSASPLLATPASSRPPLVMRTYSLIDEKQGGLPAATLSLPATWRATGRVEWKYSNVSLPVRVSARVEAPDGSAFLEAFPSELFYWLQPRDPRTRIGARSLGMIHKPHVGAEEALKRFVVARYRKGRKDLRVASARPVRGLPEALGKPGLPGESLAVRVTYTESGRPVEEEFFGHLTPTKRLSYRGPQGTTYENHRALVYVHSMGARGTTLDSVRPLLGFIASSMRPEPAWDAHAQRVFQRIAAQFNRNLARGYATIAAAAQLSRTISANNDAMLRGMSAQRTQRAAADTARRAATAQAPAASSSDKFSQYIRGVERTKDPYWGTSEHSNQKQYHWTDSAGNYRHSNDATFNPNIGSNQNWALMERAP